MSTTRHLINRQRRLAAVAPVRVKPRPTDDGPRDAEPRGKPAVGKPRPDEPATDADDRPGADADDPAGGDHGPGEPHRIRARLPVVLGVLTVLLGGFAAFAGTQASGLRDNAATSNVALSDVARTTEVKGQVTSAVNALFSYNYADTGKADRAAGTLLTGKAVKQHQSMLAAVRAQAAKQKLVLTTTVTGSGVEMIDGNRARVLLFADQSNTNTAAKKDRTTYAAAMFAVDAVRSGGSWKISNIDTFTG